MGLGLFIYNFTEMSKSFITISQVKAVLVPKQFSIRNNYE